MKNAPRPANWRSILVSRPVLFALTLTGCLFFYLIAKQSMNDTLESFAFTPSSSSSCSSKDCVQWQDVPKENEYLHRGSTAARQNIIDSLNENQVERPLSVYPGRKPKTVQLLLKEAHQRYQRMLKKREEVLKFYGWGTGQFSEWHKVAYFWIYFPAAFNCPHEIERVGPLDDGGKWVCGMSLYTEEPRAKCVLYSFGVNKETRFEGEMLDRTDCEIWAYDASVTEMGPETHGRPKVHFYPYYVGKEDTVDYQGITYKTIKTLMKENGHDWIDILKIDIEHNEYQTLNAFMDEYELDKKGGGTLPFGQLLIEIHVDPDFIKFPDFKKFWERLESFGVYPWWTEPNLIPVMFGHPPYASEYCFLNTRGGSKNLLIQNY
ncbi:hypothetical protein BGZ83_011512 [Gryganskiella cystojenkinii]|nr:hypothetical protein BGZ83_011512 [Gryganskiella cystojenkinii]